MTTRHAISLALLGTALLAGPARAQVYRWVDKEGTVHFEQEPPATGQPARIIRLPAEERAPVTSPEAGSDRRPEEGAPKAAPPAWLAGPDRAAARPKPLPRVDLYTTAWCPWCKKAKAFFASRGIAFTEHDIEAEASARERRFGLDRDKRVPVAIIGGKLVRGYAPARYQEALEQR
jgi:glutaredoxin